MRDREHRIALGLSAVFIILITLPYLIAWQKSDNSWVFGGFLLNPIDGNSYLAKMREGLNGAWTFTLPYTPQPGEGAFLNVYYLFLGHVADWLNLSLIFVFHLARACGAALLCYSLYRFIKAFFAEAHARLWAFALVLFGSGLGWLAIAFGLFSSDFWVAEAYPFLASFANPHFALGMALQVFLLIPLSRDQLSSRQRAICVLCALILSVVYPFGWVIVAAVLTGGLAFKLTRLGQWAAVIAGGMPYVLYSLWIVNSHPQLAQWNVQNLTPAPSPFDFLISFSPSLALAAIGSYIAITRKHRKLYPLTLWALVCIALVYFPSDLQRRFISGFYIPVAVLAAYAIAASFRKPVVAMLALFVVSIPTNILILSGGLNAAQQTDQGVYILRAEVEAFRWLDEDAPGSLVLAAPATGSLLPAYADVRVLYGHPFETPEAEKHRDLVESFFSGQTDAREFLETENIDYVFYGQDEKNLGRLSMPEGWETVYSVGGVEIFARKSE